MRRCLDLLEGMNPPRQGGVHALILFSFYSTSPVDNLVKCQLIRWVSGVFPMIESMKDVASSAIDAMRSSPGLLALVLLQSVVLGIIGWTVVTARQYEEKRFELLMQACVLKKDD